MLFGIAELSPIFVRDIIVHFNFHYNNVVAFLDKEIRVETALLGMLPLAPRVFNTVEAYIQGLDPGIYRPGRLLAS